MTWVGAKGWRGGRVEFSKPAQDARTRTFTVPHKSCAPTADRPMVRSRVTDPGSLLAVIVLISSGNTMSTLPSQSLKALHTLRVGYKAGFT
jgi:hypothetical protein